MQSDDTQIQPSAPEPTELPAGHALGPYVIVGPLGAGGMGMVYRAHRAELGADFALKVLHADLVSDNEMRKRFEREGRVAAALAAHPNIVGVHDVGTTGDVTWFAMELVEGESFEATIERGDQSLEQTLQVIEQAARAVHHGHTFSVLHRDIKPSNILIGTDGTDGTDGVARVTDFGLATQHVNDAALSKLTMAGILLGTPAYMPPEQAQGRTVDARADIYSLGATLYHALGGGPPHDGDSLFEVVTSVVRGTVRPMGQVRPDLPRSVCAIVDRCLARDPQDRYDTAADLADDIARFQAGEAVLAAGLDLGAVGRSARRRAPLVLTVVAVAAAAAGLAWWGMSQPEVSEQDVAEVQDHTTSADRARMLAAAWHDLVRESGADLLRLLDRWHDAGVPDDETAQLLRRIETAAEAIAGRHPGAAAPQAWAAMARYLAGSREEWVRVPERLAPDPGDDPFPHLLRAMLHLSRYAQFASTELSGDGGGAEVQVRKANERQMREQSDAFAALQAARRSPHWGVLEGSLNIARLAQAGELLEQSKHAAVVAALEPLYDDPLLGFDASLLASLSLSAQGEFGVAAARAEQAASRGWARAELMAAMAWFARGAQLAASNAFDPVPYERAIEHLTSVAGKLANPSEPLATRGVVRMALGNKVEQSGGDPTLLYEGALTDLTNVINNNAGLGWVRMSRGRVWQLIGGRIHARSGNAERQYRNAAADFEQAEALCRDPAEQAQARVERARALCDLGHWQTLSGRDPRESMAAGLAIYAALLSGGTEQRDAANLRMVRGKFAATYAVWLAQNRLGGLPERALAEADFAAVAAAQPSDAEPWFQRGDLLGRWARQTPPSPGKRPHKLLNDSEAAHTEALERDAGHIDALVGRGGARVDLASSIRPGDSAGDDLLSGAIVDLTRAVELDGSDGTARLFRAHGRAALARRQFNDPARAKTTWAEAVADYEQVLRRTPADTATRQALVMGWMQLGMALSRAGEPLLPYCESAINTLDDGIAAVPKDAALRALRANVHTQVVSSLQSAADPEPAVQAARLAVADYREAIRLEPRLRAQCGPRLANLEAFLKSVGD